LDALNVGLAGLGTVGTGAAKILLEDTDWLRNRAGLPIRLRAIADLDLTHDRGLPLDRVSLVQDVRALIRDP